MSDNFTIIVVNATCVVKKYPLNQGELSLTVFLILYFEGRLSKKERERTLCRGSELIICG